MDRVLALCERLRRNGVDANLDQYEMAPPEGWPRWAVRQIEAAEYVLIVCTKIYRHRWDGTAAKGRGLGVKSEGALLQQLLYDSESETGKLVPIIFRRSDLKHVPTLLRGNSYYDLSSDDGYQRLYRYLTNQPEIRRPDLGPRVPLAPKRRASTFLGDRAATREELPQGTQHSALGRRRSLLLFAVLIAIAALAYRSFDDQRQVKTPPIHSVLQLLRGEILDDQTGLPLGGVLVTVPELGLEETTDQQGRYRFEIDVPAGRRLKLRAFREGYRPLNVDPPAGSDFLTHHMRRIQ
jgi:hypothetical protein